MTEGGKTAGKTINVLKPDNKGTSTIIITILFNTCFILLTNLFLNRTIHIV